MKDKPEKIVERDGILQLYWKNKGYSWIVLSIRGKKGYLSDLLVKPQRKGLGRKTLKWIQENKVKQIIPTVIKDSAMGFWIKMLKEGLISEI